MTPADLPGLTVPRALVSPWLLYVEPRDAAPEPAPVVFPADLRRAA